MDVKKFFIIKSEKCIKLVTRQEDICNENIFCLNGVQIAIFSSLVTK